MFCVRSLALACLGLFAGAALATPFHQAAPGEPTRMSHAIAPSTEELVRLLPGKFSNHLTEVNGVTLHYVEGGEGEPLILLPGWPETWWEFHKIMPELAKHYRVIAVDIRGMGGSSKPAGGYDKKTMAEDILALAKQLRLGKLNIVGHDIGAMVGYSFAANHPESIRSLVMMDVTHPDESLYAIKMISPPYTGPGKHPLNKWWFAFNQVDDLPEQLLVGRSRVLLDWIFDQQLSGISDPSIISEKDRTIYAAAYNDPDSIRAGNGWYKTWQKDIEDSKRYAPIDTPTLAMAGVLNYPYLQKVVPTQAKNAKVVAVPGSCHYIPEDKPEWVTRELLQFLKEAD